jgi:VanZ family protein
VAVYAGLLFYLSSLRHPAVPRFLFSDKILHLLFYAGFGLVFVWAMDPAARGWPARRIVGLAGLAALAYGLTDEFHQHFVLGRTWEAFDLVFDALGGLLGGGLYLAFLYIRKSRRKGKIQTGDSAAASF